MRLQAHEIKMRNTTNQSETLINPSKIHVKSENSSSRGSGRPSPSFQQPIVLFDTDLELIVGSCHS